MRPSTLSVSPDPAAPDRSSDGTPGVLGAGGRAEDCCVEPDAIESARRYMLTMMASVVALLAAIPALNVAMDPLGYARVAGWRPANPTAVDLAFASSGAWPVPHGTREAKILNVEYYRPEAVVFGSSTVWSYVDAAYAEPMRIGGRRAFNFGLAGVSAREMLAAFEHLVAVKPPQRVVVGLEFYMFSADKLSSPGFDELPFAHRPSYRIDFWRFVGRRLLSADHTRQSALLLWRLLAGPVASWLSADLGAAAMDAGLQSTSRSQFMQMMLDVDKMIVASLYPAPGRPFRFVDDEGWSSFEAIRRMVTLARTHGIELHFYISPNHARSAETIRLMGWWPEFEEWERTLVAILDADAKAHPAHRAIPLWDFGGYTSLTTDTVRDAPPEPIGFRWFADSMHFKTVVGNMLMDRIFSTEAAAQLPGDFGVRLNTSNIDAHLAAMEPGHRAYLAAESDTVAGIAEMLKGLGRLSSAAIAHQGSK